MFGKTSHVSRLKSQKQLLIAESELNRAQLSEEWQTMVDGLSDLTHRVKTIGALVSLGASLVARVTAARRRPPAPDPGKSSLLQNILNGARAASTIWSTFCARGEHEQRK
jgi:hypothetical protein